MGTADQGLAQGAEGRLRVFRQRRFRPRAPQRPRAERTCGRLELFARLGEQPLPGIAHNASPAALPGQGGRDSLARVVAQSARKRMAFVVATGVPDRERLEWERFTL